MTINELISIVNQVKAKQPQYDFGAFQILIEEKPVGSISLSMESFAFNIEAGEPEALTPKNLEEDGEKAD